MRHAHGGGRVFLLIEKPGSSFLGSDAGGLGNSRGDRLTARGHAYASGPSTWEQMFQMDRGGSSARDAMSKMAILKGGNAERKPTVQREALLAK